VDFDPGADRTPGVRVEELAAEAGVGVDTIRFYQAQGLLPPPQREGRCGYYGAEHRARLERIRDLREQGFSLAQIGRLLSHPEVEAREPLLRALVAKSVGGRSYTRAELAAAAGVPEALVRSVEAAGIVGPAGSGEDVRFGEADVTMARTARELLESGLPLPQLLELALRHANHVQDVCESAIDLFDDHVRRRGPAAGDAEAITEAFRTLLPVVTRLVALHFQHTLLNRALERLAGGADNDALEAARAATESARLEVVVDWR
jgi:DNA-binding transcriptional MerR regulator